jgi:maltose-binding protein MalE
MIIARKLIWILVALTCVAFSNCKKASTETLDEMVSTTATLLYSGTFKGLGNENVSGKAEIHKAGNSYSLKLADFYTDNGPDLKVYLSKKSSPSEFISLGDIKSTNGNQVYQIPGTPDFTQYKYVLIHCEKYNHLFGVAELKN